MTILKPSGAPYAPIVESDVKTRGPKRPPQFTDEGALKLVVQDAALAEAWLDQKQWNLHLREIDILYQSPRVTTGWENATATKANVSRFTVAKHVNTLVPTMMSGMFYEKPPFVLRPRPGTTQTTVRAKTALFGALLDAMNFELETEPGVHSQCLNGTGIWKWGCYTETKIAKKFVRKKAPPRVRMPLTGDEEVHTEESDDFEVRETETSEWKPFFEHCPLGTVLIAPGWRHANQLWRAPYVVHRSYPTFADLNKLRGREGYDIPGEAELKEIFFPSAEVAVSPGSVEQQQNSNATVHHAERRDLKTTEDPLAQPLKMDERWDGDRVMTVLQDKLLIRNEEHGLGSIPFLSANWWDIQNAGHGMGVGRLVGSDQRVEQGSMNAALDILSMAVNQQYARSRGANVPTQQIRQRLGGIVDVDGDVDKAFKIIDPPKVPAEVWTTIQVSKQASEAASGADEAFVQGSIPGRGSSVVRTATGAGGVIAANAAKIAGPVGHFINGVFIPFLIALDQMVCEKMPLAQIRRILADELGEAFEVDMNNFLNARLKYEVLAGVHLAAKKAMAQALPLMVQILENPHLIAQMNATGWTVDVKEIFEMFMEMSEWKNTRDLIRRMTPQEQKAFMALNQGIQKLHEQVAKEQARGAAQSQVEETKTEGKMAHDLVLDALERSSGYAERQVSLHAIQNSPFVEGIKGQGA